MMMMYEPTSRYLLGRHLKIFGALCIILVITTLGERNAIRIFYSSPIFEIPLSATLLSTPRYPSNTPEH